MPLNREKNRYIFKYHTSTTKKRQAHRNTVHIQKFICIQTSLHAHTQYKGERKKTKKNKTRFLDCYARDFLALVSACQCVVRALCGVKKKECVRVRVVAS